MNRELIKLMMHELNQTTEWTHRLYFVSILYPSKVFKSSKNITSSPIISFDFCDKMCICVFKLAFAQIPVNESHLTETVQVKA